jgi:DNA-directed RNA polymerase subunit E'/Rpb7
MGDPLFERRELVRNIHLESKFLQRNVQASLLAQVRHRFEGICVAEGYIQRGSLTIVDHSLGRTNYIRGGLDYTVKFQADVCMPHPGQLFQMPVTLKSKIGLHAESTPIKALLPRDLHIGNVEFDDVKEKEVVEFEVIGSRFQQGDDSIVVLGKLRTTIKTAAPTAPGEAAEEDLGPLIAAAIKSPGQGQEEKRVVTVDNVGAAKAAEGAPRRRRIRPNVGEEPKKE